MASWDDVRRIALALPETSEDTSYGNASWRVKDKTFSGSVRCAAATSRRSVPALRKGPILGVRVEHLVAKEALLAAEPDVAFTTPHFNGYPAVLLQLDLIDMERLDALIEEAWLARAPTRLVKSYLAAHR